ncbi:MAG: hypothetical protein LBR23_09065, partial [Spirochaetaceae bacterium]|nr:hypothetical protein [Spirochaetaceae bacterium]
AGSSVTATDPGKGAVFALAGSTLDIESSLVSLGSGGYGVIITASSSEVRARDSAFVLTAPTAVCFSLERGALNLTDCRLTVDSPLGRGIELVRARGSITGNRFVIDSEAPIWCDSSSELTGFLGNVFQPFSNGHAAVRN